MEIKMMNMKNLFRTGLLCMAAVSVFALLVTTGCTDLEEEIVGDFTENFTPANQGVGTRNNVNKATPADGLSGAFARLLNGTANHGSYFATQEVSSDEAVITQKGGDWFDGGIWLIMHRHQFVAAGLGGINGAWEDTYSGIFQCNNLLAAEVGQIPANRAQLRFLRAYFYWRLLDSFGRVKLLVAPGQDVPQASREEVFAFVESELLAAIPDLPSAKQEYGRANRAGAYALLSRLYLNAAVYTGTPRWRDAIDAADEVIESGHYSLSARYSDVFSPANVENVEHIFVAPFDESTGGGMNFAQMTLHYPSQLTWRLQQQPWNGYSTLEEFYNSYEATDTRRAASFIVGPQVDFNGNPILDLAFDPADEDGAPVNYTPFINQLAPSGSRQAGARMGKFSFKLNQTPDMDNDFPILRLGEVILNKAEAHFRLGEVGVAVAEIDKLRTRAGVASIAPLTEGKLLAERGRELFQEALRRTDLIRFGAWGNAWWEKPAHNNPNLNVFPIPFEQLAGQAGLQFPLTQNPGY
jgi:hypothetical protein